MDLCGKFMLTSKWRADSSFEEGLHEFERDGICTCVSSALIGNQPKQDIYCPEAEQTQSQ